MLDTAGRIRKRGRIDVLLPELGETIEFRTYAVRHMLQTGLGARILDFKNDATEEEEAQLLLDMRDILCVCSVKPKIIREETEASGYLCIDDIPDGDIVSAFNEIVETDDSRFFGTNRTAFGRDPDEYARVIDNQMYICYQIDVICARWGERYKEVREWPSPMLAEALAVIQGAEGWKDAHPPEKDK